MEYRIVNICNHDKDIQHSLIFVSVRILTKNVEIIINDRDVSCKCISDERVRGAKQELGKLA